MASLQDFNASVRRHVAQMDLEKRANEMQMLPHYKVFDACNRKMRLFFKDIASSGKPTEDELLLLAKLTTKSIAEERKKINEKSNLYMFPPEVRENIFGLIVCNYLAEFPQHRILKYQIYHSEVDSGTKGLPFKDLPTFEIALIPDQKLYCEFFALRIKQSIVELRPSFVWSHIYDFPLGCEVPAPPAEFIGWVTDAREDDSSYMKWVLEQDKRLDIKSWGPFGFRYLPFNLSLRGWVYHYPSISLLSPRMQDNIQSVEIVLSHLYANRHSSMSEYWNRRSDPTFDILSCELQNAKNLTSLSYRLSNTTWWNPIKVLTSNPPININTLEDYRDFVRYIEHGLVRTTGEFRPSLLHQSIRYFLSRNSKPVSLKTNPSFPFLPRNPKITSLAIKTLTPKPVPEDRNTRPKKNVERMWRDVKNLNKMLGMTAEESWTRVEQGSGKFNDPDTGLELDCYQLVYEAPVCHQLAICKEMTD